MKKLFWVFVTVAAAMLWYQKKDTQLSEKPREEISVSSPSTATTKMAVRVGITYAAITGMAKNLPIASFEKEGRTTASKTEEAWGDYPWPAHGRYVLWRHDFSCDVDYKVHAFLGGPITVGKNGNAFRVNAPISVDGWAGFTGDVARLLGLNRKNFNGSINAWTDLSLDVNPDWSPVINVSPGFSWITPARIEIVERCWIPVSDHVEGPIRDKLNTVNGLVAGAIKPSVIKDAIQPFWKMQRIDLGSYGGKTSFIHIAPKDVWFSGISYGDDGIYFSLGISADSEVSTHESATITQSPFPQLKHQSVTDNKFVIRVPLRAGLEDIRTAAKGALMGKVFEDMTPAGKVKISVVDIDLYPANENIVLGVKFKADVEKKIFATSGWIYLQAKVNLNSATQEITLGDPRFTRNLDNEIWNVTSAVFEGAIINGIKSNAKVSLAPKIAELKALLQVHLTNPQATHGLHIVLSPDFIGLTSVSLDKNDLIVQAEASGACDVSVTDSVVRL